MTATRVPDATLYARAAEVAHAREWCRLHARELLTDDDRTTRWLAFLRWCVEMGRVSL